MRAMRPQEKHRPPRPDEFEHVKEGTIRYLFEHDGVATPAQLIAFFGFSHARLTKILGDLEAQGYVERRGHASDRRRVIVYLTDKGRALAELRYNELRSNVTRLLEYLGEEDAVHYTRILQKMFSQNSPLHCDHSEEPK